MRIKTLKDISCALVITLFVTSGATSAQSIDDFSWNFETVEFQSLSALVFRLVKSEIVCAELEPFFEEAKMFKRMNMLDDFYKNTYSKLLASDIDGYTREEKIKLSNKIIEWISRQLETSDFPKFEPEVCRMFFYHSFILESDWNDVKLNEEITPEWDEQINTLLKNPDQVYQLVQKELTTCQLASEAYGPSCDSAYWYVKPQSYGLRR